MAFRPWKRKAEDDPLGDIGDKLSDAIKQSKDTGKTPKLGEDKPGEALGEPTDLAPPEGGGDLGMGDPSAPPSEGSDIPDLGMPSIPTSPDVGGGMPPLGDLGGGPEANAPTVEELAENVKDLETSVKELVDSLKEEITTVAAPGTASLENIPKQEEGMDEEDLDFGIEPRNKAPQGGNPFKSKVTTKGTPISRPMASTPSGQNVRSNSMLKKSRTNTALSPKRVVAEDGVDKISEDNSLVTELEEKTPGIPGEKAFVDSGDQSSSKEVEHAVEQAKNEEGVAEILFPKAASLRAARKARLGLNFVADVQTQTTNVPEDAKEAVFMAAEKKASDLAALMTVKFHSALELAHKAQERGQVNFPLLAKLAQRLAAVGVPDAEVIAAEILEGTSTDNFMAAKEAALKYMAMDDGAFLNVKATIESTPTLSAKGGFSTDAQRVRQSVRTEALAGNLGVQASSNATLTPVDGLRAALRKGTPRPVTLSR